MIRKLRAVFLLVSAGFPVEASIKAVRTGDLTRLLKETER